MEHRRMKIMHVHLVLDRCAAQFIGRAIDHPALDAAANEPGSKALGVVIAAGRLVACGAPGSGRTPRSRLSASDTPTRRIGCALRAVILPGASVCELR